MTGYDEKLAKEYVQKRDGYTHTDKDLLQAVSRVGIKGKYLLDFGCGDGRFAIAFAKDGAAKVVGIDASEEMIELAKRRAESEHRENVEFIVADGANLPFEDSSFDIVFANYVIVHFKDLYEPFAEIFRVLKPGASFIATLNTGENLEPSILERPVPIRLGKKEDGVIVSDFLRLDADTKEKLEETGNENQESQGLLGRHHVHRHRSVFRDRGADELPDGHGGAHGPGLLPDRARRHAGGAGRDRAVRLVRADRREGVEVPLQAAAVHPRLQPRVRLPAQAARAGARLGRAGIHQRVRRP